MLSPRAVFALSIAVFTMASVPAPAKGLEGRPDAVRCATWQLREAVGQEAWSGSDLRSACDQTPVGPPPNPQIGSTWNWYIWMLNGPPTALLKSCTVRGMGDHCYVVVEDSQWNVRMDQAKVDAIVNAFENASIGPFPTQGIWSLDTSHFGQPPDFDQDPRVYLLYYDFDVTSDGFFWGFDQECDDVAMYHSNETDVVYLNTSGPDPAGSYMIAVLAHEFEHLIHFRWDDNEQAWLDEGLAELAMWLYGDPDNISQFNTNPDRSLTSFTGQWYDYIKSYLFSLYFYERYGGQPTVLSLVQEPLNSVNGINAVLDAYSYVENFDDVFTDWTCANFLDDITIADGRYGYAGETLPPFNPFATHSTYPVGPLSATVQHWAADYARFLNGSALHATFDGSNDKIFRVRGLLKDDVNPTLVVNMSLDALQAGTLPLPQLGTTHDQVVMVYASASATGGLTYQYGAGVGLVDAGEISGDVEAVGIGVRASVSPRPTFVLSVPNRLAGEPSRLDVYDVSGRLVRSLFEGAASPGRREIEWDGADESGAPAAHGTYFARAHVGERTAVAKVTLRR